MTDFRARLAAMKADDVLDTQRIRYAILHKNGIWVAHNRHWTINQDRAMQFDFMASAIAYATMVLDLGTAEYTVEAV